MTGFIKKDLLLVKANLKMLMVFTIVFVILAITGTFDLTFVLPFLSIMVFVTTFSYDDYNGWNAYAVSMPAGRKICIKGKYVASVILIVLLTLISMIITYLVHLINGDNMSLLELSFPAAISVLSVSLTVSLMYPVIIKFGSTNGRIWLFVIIFIIIGGLGLISNYVDLSFLDDGMRFFEKNLLWVVPVVSALMMLISYFISEKIFKNKEF